MDLHKHLRSRHLDARLHTVWCDLDQSVAAFPLWTLSGALVGYQQYRPLATKQRQNHAKQGRYFTHRIKHIVSVWGLESWHLSPHVLFVTEGVFDAARLTELGVSAVATLSNNPDVSTSNWLKCVPRLTVAVCDPDPAGQKLAAHCDLSVTLDTDLGDAEQHVVDGVVSTYC